MKKLLVLISALFLVLGTFGLAGAANITLSPLDTFVTAGDSFSIFIVGEDFTEGAGGSIGGGLNFAWDPSLVALAAVDPVLLTFPGDATFGGLGAIDIAAGTLTGLSVTSFNGTDLASFDIATLNFIAGGVPGTSFADITVSIADVWADSLGAVITAPGVTNGSIQVNAVPIPGAFLLLGSGLIGLVGLRRKLS